MCADFSATSERNEQLMMHACPSGCTTRKTVNTVAFCGACVLRYYAATCAAAQDHAQSGKALYITGTKTSHKCTCAKFWVRSCPWANSELGSHYYVVPEILWRLRQNGSGCYQREYSPCLFSSAVHMRVHLAQGDEEAPVSSRTPSRVFSIVMYVGRPSSVIMSPTKATR